ncbi:hypothetical protein [Algibacter sp. 2305UL17-15]|uniref:hypothetical protein n=1 Tax=Algibacter sp. 2305UL17-15 TaxID=3231268 RepID=UPI003459C233
MREQDRKDIQKILESIPDEFRVIESEIYQDKIKEFYKISKQIDDKQLEIEENLIQLSDKENLVRLADIGDVKSYRKIEKIIKNNNNPEFKEFANVALKFARMNLEHQLSDEPIAFISSGLGGKGNKLRYYFVLRSKENIGPEREQKLKDELIIICNHSDSEFESIENFWSYVLIKVLVSFEFAIGNVIDELIEKCQFCDKDYFCTNVERPSKELIEQWINGEFD